MDYVSLVTNNSRRECCLGQIVSEEFWDGVWRLCTIVWSGFSVCCLDCDIMLGPNVKMWLWEDREFSKSF